MLPAAEVEDVDPLRVDRVLRVEPAEAVQQLELLLGLEVLEDLPTRAEDLFRKWDEENTGTVSQGDLTFASGHFKERAKFAVVRHTAAVEELLTLLPFCIFSHPSV